jgi:DNA endonuclease
LASSSICKANGCDSSTRVGNLSIDSRIEAFNLALRLHGKGLRTAEIQKKLQQAGLYINYDTVLSWVNGDRNPARKLRLIATRGGDLVELIGLVIGDGHSRKIMRGEMYAGGSVGYASKDLGLAERAGVLLAKVLGRERPYRPYWSKGLGIYVVEAGSKQLVEMLAGGLVSLEPLILKHPRRFLKGLYDAEGCPNVKVISNRLYPRVFLTNSDQEILRLTVKLLRNYGIHTTMELNTKAGKTKVIKGKETVTRTDVYNICIGRFSMVERFARTIGFRISGKQKFLKTVVSVISRYGTDGAYGRLRFFVQNHNFAS